METVLAIFDYLVAFFQEKPVTMGLFVFPPLLLAVKILTRGTSSSRDLLPSRGAVLSLFSNLVLMLFNVMFWVAVLAGILATLDAFWVEIIPIARPKVFANWPFALQFLFLLVLLDFANYWSHRLLHRPWMWGIHSLHHSDEHMNYSTTFRVHGLEMLQMNLVGVVIVGWMDLPIEAFGAAVFTRIWYSMYIHSGLPFDHGRLRKVFASPNYHRWHHADDPAVYGKNLCDMFPVWDLMFGTHYDPGTCDIPSGVSDAPSDVVRAQVFPVVYLWRRLTNSRPKPEAVEAEVTP